VQQIESFETLVTHLEEGEGSYAKSSLEAYFFKHAFTGSSFEKFCDKDPDNFTAKDIVAVSMLSVNIPPSASRWILGDGQKSLNLLLQDIEENLSIDSPMADLTKGSTAWNLWKEIHELWGVGETKASKLLAAKRPFLFPIYDQHVAKALQLSPDDYWQPWQKFMQREDGIKATKIVRQLAKSLDKPHLSPLRLFDIVIWMQQHGHTFIKQKLVDEEKMIRVNYAKPT
jgi:Family of unknown function (DUF6308)